MRLHLPPDLNEKLKVELRRAASREIGGLLVGEHVGDAEFRLVDLSVQRSGGNGACFVRRPEQHAAFLKEFFARTDGAYERFNYIGEWHSHPNFTPTPSSVDLRQMQDIVALGPDAPHFAILIVVRLESEAIRWSALAFRSRKAPAPVEIVITERPAGDPPPQAVGWWQRLFTLQLRGRPRRPCPRPRPRPRPRVRRI